MGTAYDAVDAATLHLKFETLTLGCTFYINPDKIPDKVSWLTSVSIWILCYPVITTMCTALGPWAPGTATLSMSRVVLRPDTKVMQLVNP